MSPAFLEVGYPGCQRSDAKRCAALAPTPLTVGAGRRSRARSSWLPSSSFPRAAPARRPARPSSISTSAACSSSAARPAATSASRSGCASASRSTSIQADTASPIPCRAPCSSRGSSSDAAAVDQVVDGAGGDDLAAQHVLLEVLGEALAQQPREVAVQEGPARRRCPGSRSPAAAGRPTSSSSRAARRAAAAAGPRSRCGLARSSSRDGTDSSCAVEQARRPTMSSTSATNSS